MGRRGVSPNVAQRTVGFPVLKISNGEPVQSGVDDEMTGEAPTTTQKGFESSASCDCGKTVDRASRFLFPFVFVVFNVFYWWHFLI